MNSTNEGRWNLVLGVFLIGLFLFAFVVNWNGIINPPPKPTAEQIRQAKLQTKEVERQLLDVVRQVETQKPPASFPAPPAPTPFRRSEGNAQQKYERAITLPPNWATQECVDIVVRYPKSQEATHAANMLIDKWDHILDRDFLMLTGQRLPTDYDPPQTEVVAFLKAAFARRGVSLTE